VRHSSHPSNQRGRPLHPHHSHRARGGPGGRRGRVWSAGGVWRGTERTGHNPSSFSLSAFSKTLPSQRQRIRFPCSFSFFTSRIGFREQIPVNEFHRPFHRSQQLPDALGACGGAGRVALIALQIRSQFTHPQGLRIIAQTTDRDQALRASCAPGVYLLPHPGPARRAGKRFRAVRSGAAILLADRVPGV